jgi:hypothetical protein
MRERAPAPCRTRQACGGTAGTPTTSASSSGGGASRWRAQARPARSGPWRARPLIAWCAALGQCGAVMATVMEWCAVGTAVTDAMLLLGTDCLAWHMTLMCASMSVNRPPAVPSCCHKCAACRASGALHGPWRARRAHGNVPATTAHLRLASAAHAFAAATHSLAGLQHRVQAVQPGLQGAGHGGGVAAGGAAHAARARAQGGVCGLPAAHASVAGAAWRAGLSTAKR